MSSNRGIDIIHTISILALVALLCMLGYIVYSSMIDGNMRENFCQEPNVYAYNDDKVYCNGAEYVCNYELKQCYYVNYQVKEVQQ